MIVEFIAEVNSPRLVVQSHAAFGRNKFKTLIKAFLVGRCNKRLVMKGR